jgi:hypothetical protein
MHAAADPRRRGPPRAAGSGRSVTRWRSRRKTPSARSARGGPRRGAGAGAGAGAQRGGPGGAGCASHVACDRLPRLIRRQGAPPPSPFPSNSPPFPPFPHCSPRCIVTTFELESGGAAPTKPVHSAATSPPAHAPRRSARADGGGARQVYPHGPRIFWSSTVSDFAAEREAVRASALPRLQALCARRGLTATVVDARSGFHDDDAAVPRPARAPRASRGAAAGRVPARRACTAGAEGARRAAGEAGRADDAAAVRGAERV